MLNLRQLQDKKIKLASAKHSEIDIESEGKVLNPRRLRNRKIFVTSERSSGGPLSPDSPNTLAARQNLFILIHVPILLSSIFLKILESKIKCWVECFQPPEIWKPP